MSLPVEGKQRSLFDVPVLAAELFQNAADRYRILRENVLPALWARRGQLAELYCEDNGRPAIEPVLALGVTLLQFMEKAPDAKAADSVRLHLGWKYALDVEIGYKGFHPTSLVKFRNRLIEGGTERIGFDALLDGLRKAGLVKKRSKQRLDSTHVLGAVARMSRLEMVRETIRLFLVAVARQGLAFTIPQWSELEERYIDCEIQWHRADVNALKRGSQQAGADAVELVMWARQQPAGIRDSDKALLLERVFLEQYDLCEEDPHQVRKQPSGCVVNPHDPDVQWAAKDLAAKKQWEGFKAQVAETVDQNGETNPKGEPTEQFLTEVTTTEAIASDLDGHKRVEQNQQDNGQEVAPEVIVDAAYVTAETLAEAQQQGRTLIGPARPTRGPKGCFGADEFDVDLAARKAVCPAGHESRQCSRLENQATGKVDYRFEWAGLCDDCKLQKQCTNSRNGRRMLVVGEHHQHLQQRRREMQTDEFKKRMQQRNAIEGTISEFTRLGGRRTRYRGLAKTTLGNYFLGAAMNARRWIHLLQWQAETSASLA